MFEDCSELNYHSFVMNLLTIKEASERLSIGVQRVHQLIRQGTLKAQKVGNYYVIDETQLQNVQTYGKAGRPKKTEVEKALQSENGWNEIIDRFAGCLDSEVTNLGSNKRHLEGFGSKKARSNKKA